MGSAQACVGNSSSSHTAGGEGGCSVGVAAACTHTHTHHDGVVLVLVRQYTCMALVPVSKPLSVSCKPHTHCGLPAAFFNRLTHPSTHAHPPSTHTMCGFAPHFPLACSCSCSCSIMMHCLQAGPTLLASLFVCKHVCVDRHTTHSLLVCGVVCFGSEYCACLCVQ